MNAIAERLAQVTERIQQAAQRAGRSLVDVRLVVVTKGHSAQVAFEAAQAGARFLGENYVEEALEKQPALAGLAVQWHMIGHVQSRKAEEVSQNFDYLHSLDNVKLAKRLARFAQEANRTLPVLLECNTSGEENKFGFAVWDETRWPDLLPEVEEIAGLPHLKIRGLMTMAPFLPDPESTRAYFRRLRMLRDYLAARLPQGDWQELSMGMSGDFEVAIQEGATWVRIGQAILGPRPVHN